MISIVVLNYKNPALLRLCLKSITRNVSAELEHEVIVVDSQTSPETQNVVLEEFPAYKLIQYKKNVGYTRGLNIGLEGCRGDKILFLNPDIVILKGAVEKMSEYMNRHPDIGLLGPKLLNFDGSFQQSCFGFYGAISIVYRRVGFLPFKKRVLGKFLMADADFSQTMPVDWLMGSAYMADRKAIEKTGKLDEKFFHYFSDVDWAKRFWENGYKVVYFPEASMYHYHQRESKKSFWILDALFNRQAQWHIIDGFRFLKRWGFFKTIKCNDVVK